MASTHRKHRATKVTPDKIVIDWDSAWKSANLSHKQSMVEKFEAYKKDGWRDVFEVAAMLGLSVHYTRDVLAKKHIYDRCIVYNGQRNVGLYRPKTT